MENLSNEYISNLLISTYQNPYIFYYPLMLLVSFKLFKFNNLNFKNLLFSFATTFLLNYDLARNSAFYIPLMIFNADINSSNNIISSLNLLLTIILPLLLMIVHIVILKKLFQESYVKSALVVIFASFISYFTLFILITLLFFLTYRG